MTWIIVVGCIIVALVCVVLAVAPCMLSSQISREEERRGR